MWQVAQSTGYPLQLKPRLKLKLRLRVRLRMELEPFGLVTGTQPAWACLLDSPPTVRLRLMPFTNCIRLKRDKTAGRAHLA